MPRSFFPHCRCSSSIVSGRGRYGATACGISSPEFDALLCGYDSKARDRFVTPEHHRRLWNDSNGMLLPPLLVDGRITGFWRAAGTARRRPLEVTWFARTRRPRRAELDEPVAALESALGITVTEVTVSRDAA